MKLSKKKQERLYSEVHEEIMQARIKIWKMKEQRVIVIGEIDDIMSSLCISAPQKAIDVFK